MRATSLFEDCVKGCLRNILRVLIACIVDDSMNTGVLEIEGIPDTLTAIWHGIISRTSIWQRTFDFHGAHDGISRWFDRTPGNLVRFHGVLEQRHEIHADHFLPNPTIHLLHYFDRTCRAEVIMADHYSSKASEFGLGDDLHAVILRTCVVTPKNKKAFTVWIMKYLIYSMFD